MGEKKECKETAMNGLDMFNERGRLTRTVCLRGYGDGMDQHCEN